MEFAARVCGEAPSALPSPDPLDAFDVHHPPCVPQHGCDSSIAIAAFSGGERNDVGGEPPHNLASLDPCAVWIDDGQEPDKWENPDYLALMQRQGARRLAESAPGRSGLRVNKLRLHKRSTARRDVQPSLPKSKMSLCGFFCDDDQRWDEGANRRYRRGEAFHLDQRGCAAWTLA